MILNCKVLIGEMERCGRRTVGTTGMCHTHLRMLSKAEETAAKDAQKLAEKLLKAKEVKTRKSIAKVSEKQKTKNEAYNERVKVWKVENPKCKAMVDPDCTGETRDCHHMKKRGDLLMVEKYWLPVCGFCHDWIGRNSDEARRKGLTINHLEPEYIEPHKI